MQSLCDWQWSLIVDIQLTHPGRQRTTDIFKICGRKREVQVRVLMMRSLIRWFWPKWKSLLHWPCGIRLFLASACHCAHSAWCWRCWWSCSGPFKAQRQHVADVCCRCCRRVASSTAYVLTSDRRARTVSKSGQ